VHREELTAFYGAGLQQHLQDSGLSLIGFLVGGLVDHVRECGGTTPGPAGLAMVSICDVRHEAEISNLRAALPIVITVRVTVTDDTRRKRGWVYDKRKDNDPTETGLDGYNFDYTFDNDGEGPRALKQWANQSLLPRMAQLLS
jgi:hypothetical protein